MKPSLIIVLLSLCFCSCSVTTYGQVGKKVAIKDVAGVSQSGDSYEVIGNVDLKGKTLVIPKGKKVIFSGGKIANGTVVLDETQLEGDVCIDCEIQGSITNNEIKASWFGLQSGSKTNQTKKLQSMINLYSSNVPNNSWDIFLQNPEPSIIIPAGEYNIGEIILRSYVTIKGAGRGSTVLRGATFKANKQFNISIEDISLVGNTGGSKNSSFELSDTLRNSAFKFVDCARLIIKNVSVRSYDVAFDFYNTYLVDLYSCFFSYCNVCYLNDGKGQGYGGHAIRWYGGEMCESKFGFVQKNGNGVLLSGATFEGCKYGINLISPSSFTINACYFESNSYDIYGAIVHVNIENNFFSRSGKVKGDAFIYASTAIGNSVIQGNAFSQPVFGAPHIILGDTAKLYGNIMIGQNDIVHGGRIPVSEQLLPFVYEKGSNSFQTYMPDGNHMLMGQTIVYKNQKTGDYYLVTRDEDGNLLFLPFNKTF